MAQTAVVLAAGHGTRMKSQTHKVLHPVCGKPMIHHLLDSLREAGMGQVVVVVGQHREQVEASVRGRAQIAVQEKQLGTADAVRAALPLVPSDTETVVVLYGDAPLIRPETILHLMRLREENRAACVVLAAEVANPKGLGRVFLNERGEIERIVEEKDATPEERAHRLINTGIYAFRRDALEAALREVKNDNAQGEYYLTDTALILSRRGERVIAHIAEDEDEIASVNNRAELARVEAICRRRILTRWMTEGVTVVDPSTTYIEADVELAPDVTLLPGTMLAGRTRIAAGAVIGPHTRLVDTVVREGARVQYTVAVEAVIGENAEVGPFAYLRPGAEIGRRVKIGDFVEVKNSRIGDDTKVSHLAYVGDADVGRNVNVGCGAITVNYDGEHKHRTVIGDDSFIGSNVNLIAPVTIGKGAYVVAGTTVTEDVGDDGFAIGRVPQTTKPNYVRAWKARRQNRNPEKGGNHCGH
ncbi:bifunctional UDP-N-acetylglucosamine diphosphorylase/glucosamine-1-phosphate N-acetyltransferase GlmU [Alicyclobacillus sendaiensis]|uniref:Bifunctional protein GlmU n=1 Tax=Alicyclobacillus sendaiensis PA2 TaxID=3029425 RepID=A0ABT6Y0E7_ALISE|nr:bifunctional UDP-N-acetylglucosamine diphosphorylase/glucosamine-1-phosphate N-acetyltransferase GlmU [Alicyclobacillus sendaiensis]MDI9260803.1 bifunctional UDP-N-acetylglucosamine diphosphorylase/glucosamine-1-phosphate N-acetyltransferase GlmU [Alicyclobacillus sendaiensis PA2]